MRIALLLALAVCCTGQFRQPAGMTPENAAALSWSAREELGAGNYTKSLADGEQVERAVRSLLGSRKLDENSNLALALGASYEVQAQSLAALQRRAEAIQLLQAAEREWRGTSIISRLQKNVLLLTMVGHPLPEVRGVPNTWRGKPVLLFFWAHWCADCKADGPIIAKLAAEFESKDLVVVAPTQLYGYTVQEEHASPAVEKAFIDKVFQRFYAAIPHVIVPLEGSNFDRFGASTTPTLVIADRRGIVRLYHPGYMDESSLRARITDVVAPAAARRSASGT